MTNITARLNEQFYPEKSLVIYRSNKKRDQHYIESFDFNEEGKMINAHPLTENEMIKLGKTFLTARDRENKCFVPKGLLNTNILYIRPGENGYVIWQTPASYQRLLFTDDLGLITANYPVPALLWKASIHSLEIYALKNSTRATTKTSLYHAPYFNIYENGNVCMGTVDIDYDPDNCVEGLISHWETNFFNSKFSHLLADRSPVKSNIIQLYQSLQDSKKPFPSVELKPNKKKLKDLIYEY